MARKALQFDAKDERFVEALIRYGVSATDVARELDIDVKTLAKHFGSVIERAKARRHMAYVERLFQRMRAGSAQAAIKLEKMGRRGPAWLPQT
jgi:DNA-binding CsgD family transcriptional regulator